MITNIEPQNSDSAEASGVEAERFESPATTTGQADTPNAAVVSASTAEEFKLQNEIVKRGAVAFIEVGEALAKIRDGELWRAGEHTSWAAYCQSVAGLSKSYANRIIEASKVVMALKQVMPIGATSDFKLPTAESQVRPLLLLETPEQCSAAWTTACEKSGDAQPTAAEVKKAVLEILPPAETPASKPAKAKVTAPPAAAAVRPTAQAAELVTQIKDALTKRDNWDEFVSIVSEIEALLAGVEAAA